MLGKGSVHDRSVGGGLLGRHDDPDRSLIQRRT
jgi:hypothetical protein